MKKLLLAASLAGVIALSGCAVNTAPLTRDQVAAKVAIKTGYPGCKGCNLVRTYAAPQLYRQQFVNDPDFHGWLDLNLQLVSTNYNTADHAQAYRIVAAVIVNGGFVDTWRTNRPEERCPTDNEVVHGYHGFHAGQGIEFWLVKSDGTYVSLDHVADLNGETIKNLECFNSTGSGASWTQMIDLPVRVLEDANSQNQPIRIFAGRTLTKYGSTSDGYKPVTVAHEVRKGLTFEFSPDYVDGFVDGLKRLGADTSAAH